jgi:hypothetical protein
MRGRARWITGYHGTPLLGHILPSMSFPSGGRAPEAATDGERLPRLFVLIVLVEAVTIAALYWFGRHFA